MPKTQIDYSNTVIYKIVCKDPNVPEIYVGSTSNFTKRKCQHKRNTNHPSSKEYNNKKYQYIRDNGGWDNFDMIEIEKYQECKDNNEKLKREREWFDKLNATTNKTRPIITHEEYIEYQKDYMLRTNYPKEYYKRNKEKIIENQIEYQKSDRCKAYQKAYRQKNKAKLTEWMKAYRLKKKQEKEEKLTI